MTNDERKTILLDMLLGAIDRVNRSHFWTGKQWLPFEPGAPSRDEVINAIENQVRLLLPPEGQ